MALPADVPLAVGRQVHARNSFLALRPGCVAVAAKCARGGLGRAAGRGVHHVQLLGLVAARARQQRVVRNSLGPGDLAVARAAIFRRLRRLRRVRIMAAIAGLQRVMRYRIDLREPGGPARDRIRGTTGRRRACWGDHNLRRRFSVLRGRPVAHLTSHVLMPVSVVHLDNLFMAGCAGLVPGVFHLGAATTSTAAAR